MTALAQYMMNLPPWAISPVPPVVTHEPSAVSPFRGDVEVSFELLGSVEISAVKLADEPRVEITAELV